MRDFKPGFRQDHQLRIGINDLRQPDSWAFQCRPKPAVSDFPSPAKRSFQKNSAIRVFLQPQQSHTLHTRSPNSEPLNSEKFTSRACSMVLFGGVRALANPEPVPTLLHSALEQTSTETTSSSTGERSGQVKPLNPSGFCCCVEPTNIHIVVFQCFSSPSILPVSKCRPSSRRGDPRNSPKCHSQMCVHRSLRSLASKVRAGKSRCRYLPSNVGQLISVGSQSFGEQRLSYLAIRSSQLGPTCNM